MKYVLLTGAAGGMGSAASEILAHSDVTVFALDRRRVEEKEGIIPIVADVTDEESLKNALLEISKITPVLDGIIHFAGIYVLDSLVEMEREKFTRTFNINTFGPYSINRIFMPLLKRGSRIITVTSELATLDPLPFTGLYAITKAALDRYCYSLKMELQLHGINVSVLRAGAVETDMIGASTAALDDFCKKTTLYSVNAKRFRNIVEGVEARSVSCLKLARKVKKIFFAKNPRFAYSINRNPLLVLLQILPPSLRFFIIGKILK